MYDICSIGHITRDRIVTPERTVNMSGGTSFYMAEGISHLPRKVSFQLVTKVGDDQLREVERIKAGGVDTVCYHSRRTVVFENSYGTDSNNRTQRVLDTADAFTLDDIRPLDAKVFHLGSLLADDFPPEVVETLAAKGRVSIDVQGYLRKVVGERVIAVDFRDKDRILACTDILKLNEHEMYTIDGDNDARAVARHLAASGVSEVVITLGSYGSLIYAGGRYHEIPAYRPERVVDTTGCGDTFSTGYLYCRALGADVGDAGRYAAAMCTLKLEHSGPFDKTEDDILKVIRERE
ncbi:MAG: PfkB family carbohydrate kinase [Prevotella sp.]|nr:PfkB family carbohydrate kinase [Prevotella sp.]